MKISPDAPLHVFKTKMIGLPNECAFDIYIPLEALDLEASNPIRRITTLQDGTRLEAIEFEDFRTAAFEALPHGWTKYSTSLQEEADLSQIAKEHIYPVTFPEAVDPTGLGPKDVLWVPVPADLARNDHKLIHLYDLRTEYFADHIRPELTPVSFNQRPCPPPTRRNSFVSALA